MTVLNGDQIIIPLPLWSEAVHNLRYHYDDYGMQLKQETDRYIIPLPKDDESRERICFFVANELDRAAEEYDEEISKAAEKIRERNREAYLRRKEEQEKEEEQRKKESRWKDLSENGCGVCPYRRIAKETDKGFGEGDYGCEALGEVLKEKNFGKWDVETGVYSMFNWKAMPSEKCPYNPHREIENA